MLIFPIDPEQSETTAREGGEKGEEDEEEQAADSCVLMRRVPRPASETFTTRGRHTKAGEVFLDSSASFYGGG